MCLAIPLKILEIAKNKAIVGSEGHQHEADLSLISDPQVGDYVLVHADMAINKLSKEEAEKILKITKEINNHE